MLKEARLIQPSVEEMASMVKPLMTNLLSEYERRSLGSEFWRRQEQWFKDNPNRLPNPYTGLAMLLDPPVGGS